MSVEAQPLDQSERDLSEEDAELVLVFMGNAELRVRSSTAISIAVSIARETILWGESRITHKDFGRRTGACRRSIDKAIKTLRCTRLIERIGTTESGVAVYRAAVDARRT